METKEQLKKARGLLEELAQVLDDNNECYAEIDEAKENVSLAMECVNDCLKRFDKVLTRVEVCKRYYVDVLHTRDEDEYTIRDRAEEYAEGYYYGWDTESECMYSFDNHYDAPYDFEVA